MFQTVNQSTFFYNTWATWLESLGIAGLFVAVALLSRRLLQARFQKESTSNAASALGKAILDRTGSLFLVSLGFLIASHYLTMPPNVVTWLDRIIGLILVLQFGAWGTIAIREICQHLWITRGNRDSSTQTAFAMVEFIARLVLFVLLSLILLNNLGVNITALVAGLGVGGIAVALAVQKILGDLLSSLTIVLDKPFHVGDYLVVGDTSGRVTRIGVRTTRLTGDNGEEIIYPNSDLIQSRIRNMTRIQARAAKFQFTLQNDLRPYEILKITTFLKELISQNPKLRFDRAHLISIQEPSFRFEVAFAVKSPDYSQLLDEQQAIFITLLKYIDENGYRISRPPEILISHANPETQTVKP